MVYLVAGVRVGSGHPKVVGQPVGLSKKPQIRQCKDSRDCRVNTAVLRGVSESMFSLAKAFC